MFWTACLLAVLTAATAGETKPDLKGFVVTEDGEAIAGATVCIYTAAVRHGYSTLCPSCYLDCTKQATTDDDGHFVIRDLDPELLFRVLTLEEKCQPKFAENVDPLKGELKVVLKPRPELPDNPQRYVRGRVVDASGKPVAGAIVNPLGCKTERGHIFGAMPNVDPLAISNAKGEFILTAREDAEALDLRIEARDLVVKNFGLLSTEQEEHQLAMTEGAYVKGRLLKDGKPVANVAMGLVQADPHGVLKSVGMYTVGTDEEGRFFISNVPANEELAVFGTMESLAPAVVPMQIIHTDEDGKTLDVGDVLVEPGHRVAGKVVLSDGKPVPSGTRITLSRHTGWRDLRQVQVAPDGSFTFDGVPEEAMHIAVGLPGYRLSEDNASLDKINRRALLGLVDRDINDLTVLLEPGAIKHLTVDEMQPYVDDFRALPTKPLEGAKAGP